MVAKMTREISDHPYFISEMLCEAQKVSSSMLGSNKGGGILFYSGLKEAYSAYVPFLSGLEVGMRKRRIELCNN